MNSNPAVQDRFSGGENMNFLLSSDIVKLLLITYPGRNRRPNFDIFVVLRAFIVGGLVLLVWSRQSFLGPIKIAYVFLVLFKEGERRVSPRLKIEEKKALTLLKYIKNRVTRIQDKGSRFVLLTNEDHEDKMEHQIARISVKEIMKGTSQKCTRKFKLWIKTWHSYKT